MLHTPAQNTENEKKDPEELPSIASNNNFRKQQHVVSSSTKANQVLSILLIISMFVIIYITYFFVECRIDLTHKSQIPRIPLR